MSPARRLAPTLLKFFPYLKRGDYRVTSEATPDSGQIAPYNCIAWAAEIDNRWWWPGNPNYYWPPGIPNEEKLVSFIAAFETLGYKVCATGNLEPNMEKIAIYVDSMGTPTHMARQLPSGKWTSKLGSAEDIEHRTPDVVGGPPPNQYGSIAQFMRRASRSFVAKQPIRNSA